MAVLRPVALEVAGGWTAVGAASLHGAASDQSDASWAAAPLGPGELRMALEAPSGSVDISGAVVLRARWWAALDILSPFSLQLSLWEGSVEIASFSTACPPFNGPEAWDELVLTTGQKAAVGSWSGLSVRAAASYTGAPPSESPRLVELELVVPDSPAAVRRGFLPLLGAG